MRREHLLLIAAAALAVLGAFSATSPALRARASAQLDVAAGSGDDGPVTISAADDTTPPARSGFCPPKWAPHVPRYAHTGRHALYHHPGSCSPNLNAPQQLAYDWRFNPPAEGDL